MPLYEYRNVDAADETREFEFPLGEAPHEFTAEGKFWRRIYSLAGVIFKGPGFYNTDHGG